ncbi:MFS transporter [Desulforhopalus singaporensis]|uniref:Sugar phosphate permease n=1 Tax=Desulforhopalus singaporensis TaxID=91360 RepID=A0A1H0V8C9_9BACT|nr:MFS transporter [Desulforhopalus singaporensis]SDP74633.1 Sugar phosphate permease [Desulforhopalus singaporensis]
MAASNVSTNDQLNSISSVAGQWPALALCYLATVAIFIPYVGYSTAIPQMMQDLGMNYTMVGTLASVTALAGGIVLPFAGVLVDRWGAKKVTVLGLLISFIGQLIFSYMPNYEMMLLSRIILGAGIVLLFVAPYTLAIRWFEESDKIAVSLGVMLATDGIGTLGALYLFSKVLTAYGWRNGSALGSIVVFVMFVIALFFLKEPPKYTDVQEKRDVNADQSNQASVLKEYFAVIGRKNVIIASSFLIGVWGSYAIAVYWVPTLLMEAGWSESLAGFLGALYPVTGMVGSIVFGLISDNIGKRKPLILISGLVMALSFVAAAFAVSINSYGLLAAMLPLSGLFAYSGLPICYALAADTVGVKLAATANGFIMSAGLLIGGLLYPLALGIVRDQTQAYTWGFIVAAASLLLLNFLLPLAADDVKAK